MGYHVISYVNNEIKVSFRQDIENLKSCIGINEGTILIETDKEKPIYKISQLDNYNELLNEQQIGFIAEEYFKKTCTENSLIPIRMEQTKESYKLYNDVLKLQHKIIHRPDYYILRKDCFVEVKSCSRNKIHWNYYKIYKIDLDAYKLFCKYSKKTLYFAVYTINENKEVLSDSLAMIKIDDINELNENVINYGNFFEITAAAFVPGLQLLLD